MKTIPAILFFMLMAVTGDAQSIIKGKVVNVATGAGIPGSSIFITNTSKGTVSDGNGFFQLENVPAGKHELVISSVGYTTATYSFNDAQLPLQLKVELTVKVKELENVVVEQSVEEGWDKWGKTFMDNFVGTTAEAAQCRIRNEQKIRFRYYKKSNRVVAYCDEPIILENKALGYTVSYQLENFEVNFRDRSTFFLGYSLFEPISTSNSKKQQKWIDKRQEIYSGSVMHFMRSLYANRLAEEGFEVRHMTRVPNDEKQRVRKIKGLSTHYAVSNGVTVMTGASNNDTAITHPPDSVSYYMGVLRQPDIIETIGMNLLTADSLIIERKDNVSFLHFPNYIYVTVKSKQEAAEYLLTQFPKRAATYQRSFVVLLNDKIISMEKNGNYYDPQDFFTSGYWGWSEKMANNLPLDYEPQK